VLAFRTILSCFDTSIIELDEAGNILLHFLTTNAETIFEFRSLLTFDWIYSYHEKTAGQRISFIPAVIFLSLK
jgi:hypothetical protein